MTEGKTELFVVFRCPKCREEVNLCTDDLVMNHRNTISIMVLGHDLVHGNCGGVLVKTTAISMGLRPKEG